MTNQFGIDDIKSNPLFQKRLNSFIEDLILIESHLDEGLLIGKKQLTKRIQEFIQSIEGELPSEVKKHAELFADFNITDPCANPPIPSSIKRMTVKQDPVDFFSIIDGILPSTPKLPRIAACLNELPATSTNPLEDGGPLVIAVGDVVQLASDGGPYYVLVTELIDPQSLKGSFACAYGVRLWTAVDILGLGLPGASDIEEILGEEEVAISGYKDLIRPGTIIHRLRLLPKFWGDPEAMRSLELTFNHYFDYRKLTLSTLDFGLETEPWRILHWMRSLRIASNIAGSWRTFDFLVDRLFHTYSDFFLSFQSPVTGNNELIRLNTIVERDWLLQVPMSVLKTAKFSEDDNGGTLAVSKETIFFLLDFFRFWSFYSASNV